MAKNIYSVSYRSGLHHTIKVEANDLDEAARMGLAEYRRNFGCEGILSELPMDKVVASVELLGLAQ